MKRLLILTAIGAAAATLAACGGGGSGDEDSAAPAAPSTATASVTTQEIGDQGTVLVDSAGRALYAADQETAAGMVLCMDGCTSFWEPLTVTGAPTGEGLADELGVAERPDGTTQVTFDGKLLYTFTEDGSGEITGDGFEDSFGGQTLTWHVVHPDGGTGSSGGGAGGMSGGGTSGPYGY